MSEYIKQTTIANPISLSGVGVHSGKLINLNIIPAPENHGIKFKRLDIPGTQEIQALFRRVVDTSLATVIGVNGVIVSTIEHLMAAFSGMGVDNALVEVDGYEIPIMDGSAGIFARKIKESTIVTQNSPKQYFIVKRPVEIFDQDKSVCVYPDTCFKITCKINFPHPLIGQQEIAFDSSKNDFEKEISLARTFGFVQDLELLKKFSLGKGGSLDNAIVVDKDKILNEEGLRYPDEFVRHKLLDSLGDFSLLGMPIMGHIVSHKSGHALNHLFVETFLKNKDAWETGSVKIR